MYTLAVISLKTGGGELPVSNFTSQPISPLLAEHIQTKELVLTPCSDQAKLTPCSDTDSETG